jgi:outer membrane protein assembly factor BamB
MHRSRFSGRFELPFLGVAVILALVPSSGGASDWPQWLGPNRDGVWRETGLVTKFPAGGPRVLWRIPMAAGYSGPAVADGRIYVMDRERALDADGKPQRPTRDGIPGNERVLCLDATNGRLIWKHEYNCPYTISYPSGPRTTPLVHHGRVYTLGAMGDLKCLDSKTGKVRWAKNLCQEYQLEGPPVWGFAAHPLLDGDLLYCLVGSKDSAVVAFHKDTGKEVWKALNTEEVGYSPPMIYEAGGQRQLFIWLSESINALDPATGKLFWTQAYPANGKVRRPAVNIATVRRMGDLLFLSSFYHGPMMLKLAADKPAATVLWKGKSNDAERPDGLHVLMAPPVLKDGHIYGICASGEIRCLKADTGAQVWETSAATGGEKAACASAFLIPQGDRFLIFNDLGDMILAELSPKGYKEIDRAHILEPIHKAYGRMVVWSHPAFAQRCVFARNDKEMVCLSLEDDKSANDRNSPKSGEKGVVR